MRAGLALRSADGIVGCDLLDRRLLALSRAAGPAEGVGLVPPAVGAALVVTCRGGHRAAGRGVRPGGGAIELRDAHRVGVLVAADLRPGRGRRGCGGSGTRRSAGCTRWGPGRGRWRSSRTSACRPRSCRGSWPTCADILQKFELTASFLVHVLAGQVHTRPFVDLDDPADRAKLWPLAEAVHTLALALGGTVSTQHGTGWPARRGWRGSTAR